MTFQSPRIYTYKITFEEVPYYYYGVHKEKRFDEDYWGSPITHKWFWELYTPKKQILEVFEYNDNGWRQAQEVENRLIKPFYNEDKWCLNESYGGIISLNILRKTGKRVGNKSYEEGTGIFSLSKKELIENGKRIYKQKKGIHALSKEERVNNGKIGGKIGGIKSKEIGVGIHALSKEERIEYGRQKYEQGIGIHARTREEMSEHSKRVVKITNSQKWQCTATGYISTSGPLTRYQKARGIEASNRIRIL